MEAEFHVWPLGPQALAMSGAGHARLARLDAAVTEVLKATDRSFLDLSRSTLIDSKASERSSAVFMR